MAVLICFGFENFHTSFEFISQMYQSPSFSVRWIEFSSSRPKSGFPHCVLSVFLVAPPPSCLW